MSAESNVIASVMPKSPDTRIDSLERDLAALVAERQTMRASGAERFELERNRREIVARQHELSEALISFYAPRPAFAAA
jgi:translation elongation factor EF-1beta